MVPRIAKRGHSFKGAGRYYLHDKNADTSERVAWTNCVNTVSDNPHTALKEMMWTDMHSEDLRKHSGSKMVGRKSSAGNVYAYSLAWAPDQAPTREQMEQAAYETLEELGLHHHEAIMVAHDDTDHAHVHVVANLVHPETGLIANTHNDFIALSYWAQEYEQRCGHVYCEQRVENNAQREEGAFVKHRLEEMNAAPSIEELYQSCGSGSAFREAVEEIGYTLGKGDRRGFILVDQEGDVHSLSRQLKGIRAKQIKAYMSDVDADSLPTAQEIQEGRESVQVESEDDAVIDEDEPLEIPMEAVEEAFHAETREKRQALIEGLEKRYAQREEELRIEEALYKAVTDSTGLKGIWNAVTGRSKAAKDALTLLRVKQRQIQDRRVAMIVRFEQERQRLEDDLRRDAKRREAYYQSVSTRQNAPEAA